MIYQKIDNEILEHGDFIRVKNQFFKIIESAVGYTIGANEYDYGYENIQKVLKIINLESLLHKHDCYLVNDRFIFSSKIESLTSFCKYILDVDYKIQKELC